MYNTNYEKCDSQCQFVLPGINNCVLYLITTYFRNIKINLQLKIR